MDKCPKKELKHEQTCWSIHVKLQTFSSWLNEPKSNICAAPLKQKNRERAVSFSDASSAVRSPDWAGVTCPVCARVQRWSGTIPALSRSHTELLSGEEEEDWGGRLLEKIWLQRLHKHLTAETRFSRMLVLLHKRARFQTHKVLTDMGPTKRTDQGEAGVRPRRKKMHCDPF